MPKSTALKSNSFLNQLRIIAILVSVMIVIEIINLLMDRWLNQFSIYPRSLAHLPYIITAPFLHGSFSHFLSNILPFIVLTLVTLQFGTKRFVFVTTMLIFGTGLLVWILGRPSYHLGASGLIYGYFGYVVLAGLLSKRIYLLLISIAVIFIYGGMIWGVLPSQPFISWESHLFGFISGLAIAWLKR